MNSTMSDNFNYDQGDDQDGAKKAILLLIVFPLLVIFVFLLSLGLGWLIVFLYKNLPFYFLMLLNLILSLFISYYFINRTIIDNEDGLQENDEM